MQHLFSKLPAELRLKIWSFNLPQPRIVPIRCGASSLSSSPCPSPPAAAALVGCTSTAPIPPLLHACHESRTEALRRYALVLGIARQPGRVFLDLEHDILYFGPRDGYMASAAQLRTVLTLAPPHELARIRRVAVSEALFTLDYPVPPPPPHRHHHLSSRVPPVAASLTVEVLGLLRARLPGLRELIFVPRDENPAYSPSAVLVESAVMQKRLARQIDAAMRAVCTDAPPGWLPPEWSIMTVASTSELLMYGREVVGFEGRTGLSMLQESTRALASQLDE